MKTTLLLITLFAQLVAATARPIGLTMPADSLLSVPNAMFPRLLTDHQGKPVVTWVERTTTELTLVYRVSSDGGRTFGSSGRIALPPTTSAHGEDVPKLVFKGDGTRMVVYSLPKPTPDALRAGDLLYITSSDRAKSWTTAKPVHRDTTPGKSHSYADLTRLPNGEIGLVWLDEKLPGNEGRSVRFTQTLPGGGFGPEVIVDSNACQCCRTGILVDAGGRIYLTYRDWLSGSKGETTSAIRDISYVVSTDGGRSFSQPKTLGNDRWQIDGCPHSGPQLYNQGGIVYATWYSGAAGQEGIRLARLDGLTQPERIAGPQLQHPQLTGWADVRMAMVYEELIGEAPDTYRQVVLRLYPVKSRPKTVVLTPAGERTSLPVLLPTADGLLVAYQVWQEQDTRVTLKRIPFFQP